MPTSLRLVTNLSHAKTLLAASTGISELFRTATIHMTSTSWCETRKWDSEVSWQVFHHACEYPEDIPKLLD